MDNKEKRKRRKLSNWQREKYAIGVAVLIFGIICTLVLVAIIVPLSNASYRGYPDKNPDHLERTVLVISEDHNVQI